MRMLCGILKPTGGTVTFDGLDVSSEEYRAELAIFRRTSGIIPISAVGIFDVYGITKRIDKIRSKRKAKELLELVSLSDVGKKKIRNLFRRHEAKAWHCAGTTK